MIIGAAPIACKKVFEEFDSKDHYVICADGGYRHASPLGIKPDVLIGDMDSIENNDFDGDIINLPIRKDFTDSEVCVKYILLKKVKLMNILSH